ncbi:MAG: hypothetical protein HC834_04060 [Rhodospirillales bacterium]|nr:hypothetical protein [Rhodospirillales bacterium]
MKLVPRLTTARRTLDHRLAAAITATASTRHSDAVRPTSTDDVTPAVVPIVRSGS